MGSCYLGDYIAGDHIHRDITTLRNHNRSTALERSVINNWVGRGWRGLKLLLLGPNPHPLLLQWFETFGPHLVPTFMLFKTVHHLLVW